ncbi:9023_t:CDS:2, partial [Racocetra persica]
NTLTCHWGHYQSTFSEPLKITIFGESLVVTIRVPLVDHWDHYWSTLLSSPNVSKSQLSVPSLLSIENLANWLANPEINNNPSIISKKTAKDMFKVDGAEYTFSTWFATIEEEKIYEAGMTEKHYDNFKIVDKYEPIRESKKPDSKRLMPMKDGALNCVAQQIIEHFEKAKKDMDIVELEKILKRPIKLLDNTHGTIFNSRKYQTDRMVEYYNDNAWKAINKALQGPQAIWLIGLELREREILEEIQSIFQFVLEDGLELAEQVFGANHARDKLANEINDWHLTPASVHENIKQSCVKHGHGGYWNTPNYQVEDVVCIDMKECYPASMRVAVNGELPQDDIIGFAQIRSFKFVLNIHPVIPIWYRKHFACRSGEGCGKAKGWTPIILLRYLLEAGILESITIGEAIISLTKQTKVWLPKNQDISCAIIGNFTQENKVEEKRLTHWVVIDEGELDFLIQDCIKEETYTGSNKCPLGHILTYYEGYQPQYTHLRASILAYVYINLLEMLQRFGPNEVVRIATDSIYIRREALYKIKNVSAFFKQVKQKISYYKDSVNTSKFLYLYDWHSCAVYNNPSFIESIKVFQKTKMPLAVGEYFP